MNTFVLTCQASRSRLNTLQERLNNGGIYDYEIVNAIEYSDITDVHLKEVGNGEDWFKCSLMKNENKDKARKSVYLSHLHIMSKCIHDGINECLILEDDVVFNDIDITKILNDMPKDSVISTFDTTWIRGSDFPNKNGYWRIGTKLQCWGACCYYINDVQKVFSYLTSLRPKVFDKLLIMVHRKFPCYLYFNSQKSIKQDRKSFDSTIDVKN